MSFFETHLEGCKPSSPCARCKLYSSIFKIESPPVRHEVLRLVELVFKTESENSTPILKNDVLAESIDTLGLSVRARNPLLNDNIKTVGDLVKKTKEELLRTPNFGRQSLNEVAEALASKGLFIASKKT